MWDLTPGRWHFFFYSYNTKESHSWNSMSIFDREGWRERRREDGSVRKWAKNVTVLGQTSPMWSGNLQKTLQSINTHTLSLFHTLHTYTQLLQVKKQMFIWEKESVGSLEISTHFKYFHLDPRVKTKNFHSYKTCGLNLRPRWRLGVTGEVYHRIEVKGINNTPATSTLSLTVIQLTHIR